MANARREGYTLYPVWREVLADCETPVSAYRKLATGPYTFLLESVEGGERLARYSFIGLLPEKVLRVHGAAGEWLFPHDGGRIEPFTCADPLAVIAAELNRARVAPAEIPGMPGAALPRFIGGAVGYLGYEMVAHFERIPIPDADPVKVPDAVLIFTDTLLIFDHVAHRARLLTHADIAGDVGAGLTEAEARLDALQQSLANTPLSATAFAIPAQPERMDGPQSTKAEQARFELNVRRAQEAIAAGDIYQMVLSRRTHQTTQADPFTIYRALRALNPAPYLYYIDCADFTIAGASPEMLVRVEEREVALHPIAGTRPRGLTSGADKALEAELRYDEKEQAEHIMLVDLGRNDVGRIATPGSVRVTQMMDVERYSHVMHLVSHITGSLRADLSAFDAVRAAFPAGTLTGAPKVRAMELIAEYENERRGVYGGGIGYFSRNGNLDMAIAIRTLVIKDGVAYAQAGAGVVADSDPASEFRETQRKAEALWRAVTLAETMTVASPGTRKPRRSAKGHEKS
jgi:anthranilate synthase component 1